MSMRAIAPAGWISALLLASGIINEAPAARGAFVVGAIVWIAYLGAGKGKA